jgi:hypothetical protein
MLFLIMNAKVSECTTPIFGSFPSVQDMHLTSNKRDVPIDGIWESNDILRIRTYGLHIGHQIRKLDTNRSARMLAAPHARPLQY